MIMMTNKAQVQKLRDHAELAWAAYGYYDKVLAVNRQIKELKELTAQNKKLFLDLESIKDSIEHFKLENITYENILDKTYQKHFDKKSGKIGAKTFLGGDFSPLQLQHFFERYDLLEHQPNTNSGFSATLFGEKRKQTHTESKEVSYTADYGYTNYTLAIRGTEFKLEQIQDLLNDYYIGTNNSDMNRVIEQYFDMLLFYEETLKPLLQEKGIARINVVGHSLGGYLAQLFALSYPHSINEVYTYNAPLESKSIA